MNGYRVSLDCWINKTCIEGEFLYEGISFIDKSTFWIGEP
jgi:hypothetical protein